MEFDDQEEQEEEMGFESIGNSSRIKMTSPPGNNNNNNNNEPSPTLSGQQQQQQQQQQQHGRRPRYRECQKNHAVGIGGHAVDGCGEFMAAGSEGTIDALKCAACNCHRNFHRKDTDTFSTTNSGRAVGSELYFPNPHQVPQFTPYYRTPAGYLHVAPQQRPLALPSTSGGTHSREDQEDISNPGFMGSSARKRFRTKFTPEQKDKMLDLAEKLGWRIQKHDEEVVQQFCNETGVKRHVLKVWMHNNKHTLGKKP